MPKSDRDRWIFIIINRILTIINFDKGEDKWILKIKKLLTKIRFNNKLIN